MINKKDTELLIEIQDEITADVEMMETVYAEIDEVLKAPENFKPKDLSPELKNILAVKKRKETNYQAFIRELTELSKEYGIAVKSIGGIQIGKIQEIEYSDDETSGDLIPSVKWAE
ncbi:MAG TPA: hypothetical protein P5556_10075 [Candidatus Gastranaerophilales bacterium]|nr:hypothetical protein [Candidatus Gastranaerophilales bacterium]HSA07515.1 hypothetical protein [Candidatus Gastranaerophilales bacterium]